MAELRCLCVVCGIGESETPSGNARLAANKSVHSPPRRAECVSVQLALRSQTRVLCVVVWVAVDRGVWGVEERTAGEAGPSGPQEWAACAEAA